MILDIYENLQHNYMKDLGYIRESLPNQKLDEDFKFILSNFNYFGNSEVFKDSLHLRYSIKDPLLNQNLNEDFNSYSRIFQILQITRFPMMNHRKNHNYILYILLICN